MCKWLYLRSRGGQSAPICQEGVAKYSPCWKVYIEVGWHVCQSFDSYMENRVCFCRIHCLAPSVLRNQLQLCREWVRSNFFFFLTLLTGNQKYVSKRVSDLKQDQSCFLFTFLTKRQHPQDKGRESGFAVTGSTHNTELNRGFSGIKLNTLRTVKNFLQ